MSRAARWALLVWGALLAVPARAAVVPAGARVAPAADAEDDNPVDEPGPAALQDVLEADPENDELLQERALEREAGEHFQRLFPLKLPVEDSRRVDRARPGVPVADRVLGHLGTDRLHDRITDAMVDAERLAFADLERSRSVPGVRALGPLTSDIPLVDNAAVQQWVRFFQGVGAKYYRKWMGRYWRYGPTMRRILEEQGLPSDTVYLSMIESGFSPKAYSFAHAAGPWQFIRETGTRMGLDTNFWVDERRDPIKATYAASRFLKTLYKDFGDWHLAWASYNAGPNKLREAIRRYKSREFFTLTRGHYLRWETRNYVPKLIAAAIIAKDPAAYGFTDVEPLPPFEFDTLPVPDSMALTSLARACGTDAPTLQELNPELRRAMTPPLAEGAPPYALRVPPGTLATCQAGLTTLTESERTVYRRHRVQAGDTLTSLSRRYGAPEPAILAENNLPNSKLKPGEDLLIPVPPTAARPPLGDLGDDIQEHRGRLVRAAPPRGTHPVRVTVQPGDNLWDIATRYGVDVRTLAAWNGLNRRGRLRIGQRLLVYVRNPKVSSLDAPATTRSVSPGSARPATSAAARSTPAAPRHPSASPP